MLARSEMNVEAIIERFGGVSKLARALGHKHSTTVQTWRKCGSIPDRHHPAILEAALRLTIPMRRDDFVSFELDHPAFHLSSATESTGTR